MQDPSLGPTLLYAPSLRGIVRETSEVTLVPRVRILASDGSKGLLQDAEVLLRALSDTASVEFLPLIPTSDTPGRRAWRPRAKPDGVADVTLTLETAVPDLNQLSRWNVLIPNPEWLSGTSLDALPLYDVVGAKTHVAHDQLRPLHPNTEYLGFSSEDMLEKTTPRSRTYLHFAGSSPFKGTRRLIVLWLEHPEWPMLSVYVRKDILEGIDTTQAENVSIHDPVSDQSSVRSVLNSYAYHVCPSLTEGWGHYIVEALSVGATVITTDAPPMNYFVAESRGLAVKSHPIASRLGISTTYDFDKRSMEGMITATMSESQVQSQERRARARAWFLDNDKTFKDRIRAAVARWAIACSTQ